MSNILQQLNTDCMSEKHKKMCEYDTATKHIRQTIIDLQNVSLPKIVAENENIRLIYSEKVLETVGNLECLQSLIWESIFTPRPNGKI